MNAKKLLALSLACTLTLGLSPPRRGAARPPPPPPPAAPAAGPAPP